MTHSHFVCMTCGSKVQVTPIPDSRGNVTWLCLHPRCGHSLGIPPSTNPPYWAIECTRWVEYVESL